jgi:hypothetical protein
MANQQVCIIGGGATGAALLWCLAQDAATRANTNLTIIHDQPALGGHSLTVQVPDATDPSKTYPVDLGVQLISPMIYANVNLMLSLADFSSRVPMTAYDDLKLACAYPDAADGTPQNWGNFPAYQSGATFAMYSPAMMTASNAFETYMDFALFDAGKTVKEVLQSASGYGSEQDKKMWIDHFLWPYLSIINGYGAALMGETLIGDLLPFFMTIFAVPSTPLGSFTQPGKGWQRFTQGAQSWVQAMYDVAATPSNGWVTPHLGCTVTSVNWPDPTGKPQVTWTDANGVQHSPQTFDMVISTVDMQTNWGFLQDSKYAAFYQPFINPSAWSLQQGWCTIHRDPTVLSPRLSNTNGQTGYEQETLQFTAYYAPQPTFPFYDLYSTYTTYLQANLLGDPGAAGIYNTMYGYDPNNDPRVKGKVKLPNPATVVYETPLPWIHSKLAPSFSGPAKANLFKAQAPGLTRSYAGQQQTGLYFAGNNTTYDSEDGALEAAMIIANYAFGIDYPFRTLPVSGHNIFTELIAQYLYEHYSNVMFPGTFDGATATHAFERIAEILRANT